jgi:HK97 family phage major capsid protein
MAKQEKSWEEANFAGVKRDYNSTDGSAGGFLVPPQQWTGDIIETVYANTPILNFPGVVKLTGLAGDMPIPTDNGNLTAYHVSENGKPTVTSAALGQQWLRAKKLGCFSKVSNRLISYSNQAIENFIREKMGRDCAVEMSRGLTSGTGSNSEPKGIMQYANQMTTGFSAGTNGARFSTDMAWKLQQSLAAADEKRDSGAYAYLMRPEVLYGLLRERVIQYSGQARANGQPVFSNTLGMTREQLQSIYRASFGDTTQIAGTDTTGTSSTTSKVVYGDWSRFVLATFRDPIFRVSDVAGDGSTGSAFLEDQLYMVMFMEYDCAITRPSSFVMATGAECTDTNWTV